MVCGVTRGRPLLIRFPYNDVIHFVISSLAMINSKCGLRLDLSEPHTDCFSLTVVDLLDFHIIIQLGG